MQNIPMSYISLTPIFQSWDTFTPKTKSDVDVVVGEKFDLNKGTELMTKSTTSFVFGRQLKAIQVFDVRLCVMLCKKELQAYFL